MGLYLGFVSTEMLRRNWGNVENRILSTDLFGFHLSVATSEILKKNPDPALGVRLMRSSSDGSAGQNRSGIVLD